MRARLAPHEHLELALAQVEMVVRAHDPHPEVAQRELPPSLQVGVTPVFDRYIERMTAVQRSFQQQLMSEVQSNHLSGDSQATARQCLRGIYAFEAMLNDLLASDERLVRLRPDDPGLAAGKSMTTFMSSTPFSSASCQFSSGTVRVIRPPSQSRSASYGK